MTNTSDLSAPVAPIVEDPAAPTPPTPTSSLLHPRSQAGIVIVLLGLGIVVAMTPYFVGLLGILVLYVLGQPMHARFTRVLSADRAAVLVLVLIALFVLVPALIVLGLVLDQAPSAIRSFQENAVLEKLRDVRIGQIDVGTELGKAGRNLVGWFSSQAFDLFGVAARSVINLVIALTGVYFLLSGRGSAWQKVKEYLPFSDASSELLRERFYSITQATFYGTIVTAVVQGALTGTGFWISGIPSPVFWGTVAAFASILPLVGGAMVWLPATLALLALGDTNHAIFLGLWGALLVSNIDNVIRPLIFKKLSDIHPLTTLVGAFAGLRYFGLLGVLVGPLAITYFFELLRIFEKEYAVAAQVKRATKALRSSGTFPTFEP
ncbi:MAG: AI-2E family transporter [Gemmatimonadota bacterium]|jgi:predicted PurR-regulated permease PerM